MRVENEKRLIRIQSTEGEVVVLTKGRRGHALDAALQLPSQPYNDDRLSLGIRFGYSRPRMNSPSNAQEPMIILQQNCIVTNTNEEIRQETHVITLIRSSSA